jgi:hypothetical protein
VGRDQSELVLGFDRRPEEAVHQLESLLLIAENPAAIDALEIEVEIAILKACVEHLVDFGGILREQHAIVDGLHWPDGNSVALPFDGPRWVDYGSLDVVEL